jgi:hypothetical protein
VSRHAAAAVLALAVATPARAHHGVAAVSVAGPEGPGAALETTSALPLPQGLLFGMLKTEYVPFQQRAGFVDQKDYASFNMLALGYGVRPWLSLYAFQPLNVKAAHGLGTNAGAGDTNLMLAFAFKWDEGLRLVPEKESLDELEDWHFSTWLASTLPAGPTGARDDLGDRFAPDMQTGFGSPSASGGVATTKQVGRDLTVLADASHQRFFPHTYAFTRYQFGAETRLNGAIVWRAYGRGALRIDLAGELSGLHLERDRQRDGAGAMTAATASGGDVLYAGLGVRATHGALSVALGVRRAALRALNESALQQGSEGLEDLRATLTVSGSTRL